MKKPRYGGHVMRNAKSLTAVFGSFLLALTLTAGMAVAQSGSADSPKDSSSQPAQQTQPDQSQPSAPGQAAPDMKQPGSDTRSDFRSESRSERVVETERTKMLGMDPMVAMIVGAVLFIVVIMAIVAMSKRSSTTSVETRRTI
jgi:preprotein translocase subunit SecG